MELSKRQASRDRLACGRERNSLHGCEQQSRRAANRRRCSCLFAGRQNGFLLKPSTGMPAYVMTSDRVLLAAKSDDEATPMLRKMDRQPL
jgi:hypothetical protein